MSNKQVSSGAEKAEALAKNSTQNSAGATQVERAKKSGAQTAKKPAKPATAKKTASSAKRSAAKKTDAKAKTREEKKIHAARLREEKRQKRLERKLEHKQKRLDRIAALKNAREERKEARRERRDMLRHETKEARIERKQEEREAKAEAKLAKRKAALEERKAKREHRLKVQAEKRARQSEKQHAPGFGGWLAAVISLGVVTLALATMFTFGWFFTGDMMDGMASTHTQSLYELNSVVDNLDTNLSKARVTSSQTEQVKLLSDIAIQSEIAETILERFPTDMSLTRNMTSFVNKMGDSAQSMLYSVAGGETLSESQIASLDYMYETNRQLKSIINELTGKSTIKDMYAAMRSKDDSLMYKTFGDIENNTIETPKEIHDGPFAESAEQVSAKTLDGLEEISATRAEELARGYFKDYKVTEVKCTGETLAKQLECYNITLKTDDGEMAASLSKKGGKVVEFNSYKDCNDKNFSTERCTEIAQDFLTSIGYENMKAVWTSENGTTCNLNFAYEQDGVVIYSDIVKVKVCEQRGLVTGVEALSYVLNHTERDLADATVAESEAAEKLHDGFTTEASRLCLIPINDGEALAYEFYGTYEGKTYYIYIDAQTGDEIEVFTVVGTKQGKALM